MAICCLNLPPPASASCIPSSITKPIAWLRNEKWRKQCVLGMACMIIGLETEGLVSTIATATAITATSKNLAIAKEMELVSVESKEKQTGPRWSDKRVCPPWHHNSLEIIVPENLPRPSAKRRWEAVRYTLDAPAVKVIVIKGSNTCFSM